MSGSRKVPSGLIALVLVTAALGAADLPPEEPREVGAILLPGRLPWGATALPTGEFLAPSEDQSITVLDRQAKPVARWVAAGRFSGPVTVGPRRAIQLAAAPLVTGRVEVLVWDPKTQVLTSVFALTHPSEATATAWGVAGSVAAAWADGTIETWSAQGSRLWQASTGWSIRLLLWDEALGVYAVGPDRVSLFDRQGVEVEAWSVSGMPKGVLQTMGGDLYLWTDRGLWRKRIDDTKFTLFDPASDLLGVVVDRQDRLVLTQPQRIRRLTAEGVVLGAIALPVPAVTASALDDRGRILVGTTAGLQEWTYDGRLLDTLGGQGVASAPQLSDGGTAVWGTTDWRVHLWQGFRWPAFGWPQDGGASGRPFSARRPSSVAVRAVNWTDDPDFSYFYQLAASGEEAKQRQVLERFEAQAASGNLLTTWPFANLVLLKIARSGLTDLIMRDRNHVSNSWPGLRLRAFALLAQTASPEDRDELVVLLQKEYDPSVAAQGTQALARSGWDGDGKLLRLLADLRARMADQSVVADAVVDAARSLWVTNGKSSDPVLVPLVSALYQGPYPRTVKLKAQKFFQDLMEAP